MSARTDVEWSYEPGDYLEAPFSGAALGFAYKLDRGRIVASASPPVRPLSREQLRELTRAVERVLLARQATTHRPFRLSDPGVTHYDETGARHLVMLAETGRITITGHPVDFTVRGASGRTIRDSKAERIDDAARSMSTLVDGADRSPLIRELLASYGRAVNDPANEFVHLYEIREALAKHFGSEAATKSKLGIPDSEWKTIGRLANHEPVEQGRHRGAHFAGRRPATEGELSDARRIALKWMMDAAKLV